MLNTVLNTADADGPADPGLHTIADAMRLLNQNPRTNEE